MSKKDLFKRIVQHLLPEMDDPQARKALVESALMGSPVLQQIDWAGAAATFTIHLVKTVGRYSLTALIALLEEHRAAIGQDRQSLSDALLAALTSKQPVAEASGEAVSLPEPSANPRLRDHVFISYAHKNRPFVDQLAEDLRRRGHVVWIDFEGIRGGEVWRQSIVDGIYASVVVLVVLTPDALESEWVRLEIQTAQAYQKPLVPLLLQPMPIPDNLGLDSIQFRDFTVGYEAALKDLLIDLPKPQAGLPGYCQKLIARLAQAPWGLDHYIQGEARLLPIHASPYEEGSRQSQSENLLKQLWRNSRTIVLGEPGMGKSVALERLAWELASNDPPIVPVLIPLREYDGQPLLAWVRLKLLESDEPALRDALAGVEDVQRFLHEMPFQFYLLLDGLNEVRPQYRERIVAEIRRLALEYPRHPIVVTSRVQDEGWHNLREGSFNGETVVVQPIQPEQAQAYLNAHLETKDAAQLWQRLDARMRGLAQTPLLLWMIKEAWLESRERIPGNRGELYARFINRMLRRDDARQANRIVPIEKRLIALEKLALAMHIQKTIALPRETVRRVIANEATFEALLVNGLLQGEQTLRFAPHQTVQEHFAARAIRADMVERAQTGGLSRIARRWLKVGQGALAYADDSWWWETFIQLAGLVADPNPLARSLAESNPWLAWWCAEEGRQIDKQTRELIGNQSHALVYSANVRDRRRAAEMLARLQTPRTLASLVHLSLDQDATTAGIALNAVFNLGEAGEKAFQTALLDKLPEERAAWGRSIAPVDPRPGVGLGADGLPDIDWVVIPAGEFIYQAGEKLTLPTFEISRYPITYVQFQAFIDDPEGYHDSRWWTGLYMPNAHNTVPGNQRFKFNNHPRENVSWYDALAFCRWLSWQLGGGYDLENITRWAVRLPSEFEWEKAARGENGLIYPYGDDFDATKANTREMGIRQTSAVGIFPEGASPYGVQDMIGNVWELCLTDYHNPALTASAERLNTRGRRVVRGGSWDANVVLARVVYRRGLGPVYRNISDGFRVCRSQVRRPYATRASRAR